MKHPETLEEIRIYEREAQRQMFELLKKTASRRGIEVVFAETSREEEGKLKKDRDRWLEKNKNLVSAEPYMSLSERVKISKDKVLGIPISLPPIKFPNQKTAHSGVPYLNVRVVGWLSSDPKFLLHKLLGGIKK